MGERMRKLRSTEAQNVKILKESEAGVAIADLITSTVLADRLTSIDKKGTAVWAPRNHAHK
jgi:hypothetical protein